MDCPRCQLMMNDGEYEGEKVKVCGTCWGYWLSREQLEKIVDTVEYSFARSEKKKIDRTMQTQGDVNREGHEGSFIQCPVCAKFMERKKYHYKCPVEIDECADHGIWLDTGEIKELQIYIEQHLH